MRFADHVRRLAQGVKDYERAIKDRVVELAKRLDVDLSDPGKNELLCSLACSEMSVPPPAIMDLLDATEAAAATAKGQ